MLSLWCNHMNRLFPLALCLAMSACAPSSPSANYLTKAADPTVRVRSPVVADATAGTRAYAPAEAGDWEKINRAVTPKEGQK